MEAESSTSFHKDAQRELTASALALTVLALAPGQTLPVRKLIETARLFGQTERSARVALNRLDVEGKVRKLSRGVYGFAHATQGVQREIVNWTQSEDRVVDWSGSWLAVHTADVPRTDRKLLRRHESALRLRGLRPLRRDLWVRPDNLRGGAEQVEADIRAFGLAQDSLVCVVSSFSPQDDPVMRDLWNCRRLTTGYARMISELKASEKRLPRMPLSGALVETLSVGRHVVRQILLDPMLPARLLAGDGRQRLLEQMKRYNSVAYELWSSFLREQRDGPLATDYGRPLAEHRRALLFQHWPEG